MSTLTLTPVAGYLLFLGIVAVVVLAIVASALTVTLRLTRRDRLARSESIPAYYGHLRFAH